MKLISQILAEWLQDIFRKTFPGVELRNIDVVPTASAEFGDYQCNAALALAAKLKRAPLGIAKAVVESARGELHESVARIEAAPPGFINIFLNDKWLVAQLEAMLRAPHCGVPQIGAEKAVVIDYSSPNIAKPMHIGHIRSTVIGNALCSIYRLLGYRVISDNHLGDWGTQFGILIMGFRNFADKQALAKTPIEELERIYVLSYEKSRKNDDWLGQCRQELVKLQAGDPENISVWKQIVKLSLANFEHIYKRLGITFDLVRGESHYHDRLPAVIESLKSRNLVRESEGAQVVFLEEDKLPPCIVQKSDGAYNYATTDVATALSRAEEFKPELIIYVTDERQQTHFRQIFSICRRLGIPVQLVHVWFGLMRLPEGTFSTRQGNVIKLEALLDEAESRALKLVQQTSPQMPADQQKEVARAVGIGAVKYADLSQNLQSLVTFSWDKALALNGNSAPYLQYAYARISSVQDKYKAQYPGVDLDKFPIRIGEPVERELVLRLVKFPETILAVARQFKPNLLADYLFDLAGTYNTFYQNVPFLKAPEGIRESRVRLCGMVASILRQGLELLGIETPSRI